MNMSNDDPLKELMIAGVALVVVLLIAACVIVVTSAGEGGGGASGRTLSPRQVECPTHSHLVAYDGASYLCERDRVARRRS